MNFVLDNSVVMRWFLGDGKAQQLNYADVVLQAMHSARAGVPAIWAVELANVLSRAERSIWLPRRAARLFLPC